MIIVLGAVVSKQGNLNWAGHLANELAKKQNYKSRSDEPSVTRGVGRTQTGIITGKLCYPSEFLPEGRIVAKNIDTGEVSTQGYPGNTNGGGTTFSVKLKAGRYHLRYDAVVSSSPVPGYYSSLSDCGIEYHPGCEARTRRELLVVAVEPGKTVAGVNLCDFYYGDWQPKF